MIESQIVARVLPSKCREAVKVGQRNNLRDFIFKHII